MTPYFGRDLKPIADDTQAKILTHTHTHTCMLLLFKREKVGGEEGGVPGSCASAGLKWVRGSVGERGSAPKINRKNSKNAQRMK